MLSVGPVVQAGYDAAQTNTNNTRHWAAADQLSPNAALIPAVRRVVRSRARYEAANNSYCTGLINTLSDYIIGTGPRLHVRSGDDKLNERIQDEWRTWSQAIDLGGKLQLMKKAQAMSGEVFGLMENNDTLETLSQLDIRLIEADQVSDPLFTPVLDPFVHDGLRTDEQGHPIEYRVLRQHPGETRRLFFNNEFDDVPAKHMLHYFLTSRPGQQRGIPQITPALPLFAQLRRYTLAVLSAAESAALPAGVIQSDAPANEDEATDIDEMDTVSMPRNAFLTLPAGWKIGQFKAEHPTTTYPEFKHEILNEIARSMSIPFNIAAGNSSEYNYASGRLDWQAFFRSIAVERDRIECMILERIFLAWLREMVTIPQSKIPRKVLDGLRHEWFWDGVEHVDPAKHAKGQAQRLENHTTTLAHEYAQQGKDWQAELEQRSVELKEMKRLGLDTATEQKKGGSEDEEGDGNNEK